MNLEKLKPIISEYKRNFNYIDNEERYKWQAVKCFQDNWEINEVDFSSMLHKSLAAARNLLDSGNYFPNRMIYKITLEASEESRRLFKILFDEELDLIERITTFKNGVIDIFDANLDVANHYQDDRAIVVYLCLRYPNRYYLYKYGMFKKFIPLVDYPFSIKMGEIENVLQYFTLCNLINALIKNDSELLEMHSKRLTSKEFFDESFNILTQDIIYAAISHFPKLGVEIGIGENEVSVEQRLVYVPTDINGKTKDVVLRGTVTNYIKNAEENKRIGDLGELLVLEFEQQKLKTAGITKNPVHISKERGDGLGYDILSFDIYGNEIYIEVKCTRSDFETPFFITANELKKSNENIANFYLYRLFDYNSKKHSAKYFVRQGSLSDLCINPSVYKAYVTAQQ